MREGLSKSMDLEDVDRKWEPEARTSDFSELLIAFQLAIVFSLMLSYMSIGKINPPHRDYVRKE